MRKCHLPSLGEGIFEEDFEAVSETWNIYKLKSGTLVKVKIIVTSIVRFDGAKRPDGQSSYFVNTQNIVDYLPPEELAKGGIITPNHDPDKILS
jgi:hypothetical protein